MLRRGVHLPGSGISLAAEIMSMHSLSHHRWEIAAKAQPYVCDAGEQAVEDLLDAIPGITEEVKDAAMQVVDEFYNKIGDVMEKFEAAVLRIEKQSVDDAKKLITLVEASIKNVTDHIVDKVEELISKSVSEITAVRLAGTVHGRGHDQAARALHIDELHDQEP